MLSTRTLLSVLVTSALLTACGGGGSSKKSENNSGTDNNSGSEITIDNIQYSGSTSTAGLSDTNQDAVASDAGKAVMALIDREDGETLTDEFQNFNGARAMASSNTVAGDCGGQMRISGGENSYTIVFGDYCSNTEDGDISVNGTMMGSDTTSGTIRTIRIQYDDIELSMDEETLGIDGYMVNTINTGSVYSSTYTARFTFSYNGESRIQAWDVSCSSQRCVYESYFVADDQVYKTANYSLYEDSNGYQLSTDLYMPEHGQVNLEASDIQLCDDGSDIASGTILVTGANNKTISVEYTGCGERTATLDGVATLLN